jgi:hypothetical protein
MAMRTRLLPLPLFSVLTTRTRPTSAVERTWVPVGLLVEADDVDEPDLGDVAYQAGLRADQVVGLERRCLVRGEERDLDRPVRGDLGVDELLDTGAEALGQRVELEVHPGGQRLHVPAGHGLAPLVPDDPAQHVEGGVGPHQRMPPLPVDDAVHGVADLGQAVGALAAERVPDHAAVPLADVHDGQPAELPGVVWLPAARRIEGGPVEPDLPLPGVDLGHDGVEFLQVGVPQVQQVGRHRAHSAARSSAPGPRPLPARRRGAPWGPSGPGERPATASSGSAATGTPATGPVVRTRRHRA